MKQFSYCPQHSLPEIGTPWYYAYRHLTGPTQKLLYALDQISQQWTQASECYQDKTTTLQKLNWWYEELDALYQLQAHTPMVQQIQTSFVTSVIQTAIYPALIQDLNYIIETVVSGRSQGIQTHCQTNLWGVSQIKQWYLNGQEPSQSDLLGWHTSIELARHILLWPQQSSHGICFIDNHSEAGVIKDTLITWFQQAVSQAEQSSMSFNKAYQPLWRLNKIYLKSAKKLLKSIQDPRRESIVLSPAALLRYSMRPQKIPKW